jgi:hypothetical protein
MTPTEFDFTVTMPGDARLVGAIRQLAAHAAGYAQLPATEGEQLAGHVARATEIAMSAANAPRVLIEYRFTANPQALSVVFSCDVAPSTPRPASTTNGTVTVNWSTDGSRHVCHIRQRLLGPEA